LRRKWIVTTNSPFYEAFKKKKRITLVCFEPEIERPEFDPDRGASPFNTMQISLRRKI